MWDIRYLWVHLNSLGEPLCNLTHNRTLRLPSFQTTLNVTLNLTLIRTLKNMYGATFSHQKVLPTEALGYT